MTEQLGSITVFHEGAVGYTTDRLVDLLAQTNPAKLAGFHNMTPPDENGVRLRWMKSLPAGQILGRHALLGEPPLDIEMAKAHVYRHERELERLTEHGLHVPAHTTFVVENDPYHFGPVVYSAVENIPGSSLLPNTHFFPTRKADPERLLTLGTSLLSFYCTAPAGKKLLHDDAAWPKQFSESLVLYDTEPRLIDQGFLGVDVVGSWVRQMRKSTERTTLLQQVREARVNMRISA